MFICKQIFDSESDLDKHFLKYGVPCSKERKKEKKPKKSSLKSHENEKETKDTSRNTNPVLDLHKDTSQELLVNTLKLKCDICEKYFYSSNNLGKHVEICKKVNLPCEKCGKEYKSVKQFKRKDSLLRHTRVHYPDISEYKCPVCSTRCINEKDLQIHTVQEHISST